MRFSRIILLAFLGSIALTACDSHDNNSDHKQLSANQDNDVAALQTEAEKGDRNAQFALAVRYQFGNGVKPDFNKAADWYSKAANAGHLGAMNNLAALYFDGKGVERNYTKAGELYKQLADVGDMGATASLAGMYVDGKGVSQDYNEAMRLFLIAADHGYAPAQSSIGLMYKFGWGVPKDGIKAYAWWTLASENGDKFATDNMSQLKQSFSSSDVEQAQKIANKIRNESKARR